MNFFVIGFDKNFCVWVIKFSIVIKVYGIRFMVLLIFDVIKVSCKNVLVYNDFLFSDLWVRYIFDLSSFD